MMPSQEPSMPTVRSRLSPEIDLDGDGNQTGFLRLPHSVHRSAYGWVPIPIARISNTGGNGAGPSILLMAGNHGDEYEGQVALGRLIRDLDRPRCVAVSSSCHRRISRLRWPAPVPRRSTPAI
jgi:hypothetical protein